MTYLVASIMLGTPKKVSLLIGNFLLSMSRDFLS